MVWLLVGFYGISTLVNYLMPNQFIGNIIFKQARVHWHTVKWFQVLLSNTNNSI